MTKMIKHVCLDKDGILTDVHIYWADIVIKRARKILDRLHLSEENFSSLALAMGINVKENKIIAGGPVGYKPRTIVVAAALRYLGEQGLRIKEEEMTQIFSSVDQDMQSKDDYQIQMLEGVAATLKQFKSDGYCVSIYSSDRVENLRRITKKLGIAEFIDVMIGGDQVKKSKPDPEGFLLACEQLNILPSNSVYVGDTTDDMQMAQAAQAAYACGVTTGLSTQKELSAVTPYVFNQLNQVVSFLKGK